MSYEDDEEQGRQYIALMQKIENTPKLELTDEEWMSIIVRDRDGLPACCANISSLRDVLVAVARDDGYIGFLYTSSLAARLTWCFPSHDVPSDAIQKVLDQIGFEVPDSETHAQDKREL